MRYRLFVYFFVLPMLCNVSCGDSNNGEVEGNASPGYVALNVTEKLDIDDEKMLCRLSNDVSSTFSLDDAAKTEFSGKGRTVTFRTVSNNPFANGPNDPLLVIFWFQSAPYGPDNYFASFEVLSLGEDRLHFDSWLEEMVFDDILYAFIIRNGYQGALEDISLIIEIDEQVVGEVSIDAESNIIADSLLNQKYCESALVFFDDGISTIDYSLFLESNTRDSLVIPALVWWQDGNNPDWTSFKLAYASRPGEPLTYGQGVIKSFEEEIDLPDQIKYMFFLVKKPDIPIVQ